MKLTELLDDLTKNKFFRDTCAVLYVTEFQKRGLPHIHILIWLEERCKCENPSKIDDIISIELPSPIHDPDGYKVVLKTVINEDGYAIYRRKDKKVTANKHVVPYNSMRVNEYTGNREINTRKQNFNRWILVVGDGITLLLLLGGRTPHSRLVISLELMENSTCGIKQNTHLAEPMQEVKLIIWDEAPMAQRYAFEALDKTEIY
nr:helicase [Tanacetum cinerariifolium]